VCARVRAGVGECAGVGVCARAAQCCTACVHGANAAATAAARRSGMQACSAAAAGVCDGPSRRHATLRHGGPQHSGAMAVAVSYADGSAHPLPATGTSCVSAPAAGAAAAAAVRGAHGSTQLSRSVAHSTSPLRQRAVCMGCMSARLVRRQASHPAQEVPTKTWILITPGCRLERQAQLGARHNTVDASGVLCANTRCCTGWVMHIACDDTLTGYSHYVKL
jgi:hypothetical protein